MLRSGSFRLLAPLALLIGVGAFAFDRLPAVLDVGGAPLAASPAAAQTSPPASPQTSPQADKAQAPKASARATAANPAWGNSGTGYRYAYDGKCDDPRYLTTTGAADPGTDEYDCARLGGGLKK